MRVESAHDQSGTNNAIVGLEGVAKINAFALAITPTQKRKNIPKHFLVNLGSEDYYARDNCEMLTSSRLR